MYPRTNYEMTEENLKALLDACKPTPVMKIGSYTGSSPQENANRAWGALGKKMGFDAITVRPIPGKGQRFFSAIPSETEEQKEVREKQEVKIARALEIERLKDEISSREKRIAEIEANFL